VNAPRLISRLPGAGPIAIAIPGVTDVTVAAATEGAEVPFTWPRPYLIAGAWLSEELTADPIVTALMRLRIVDDQSTELSVDGLGQEVSVPALSLAGRSPRRFAFRRVVRAGQRWIFQVLNRNPAQAVVPQLYFFVEEILP